MDESEASKIDIMLNVLKQLNIQLQTIIFNYSRDGSKVDLPQKQKNSKLINELERIYLDLIKKDIRDMRYARVVLSPLFYRAIRRRVNDPNFMRLQTESTQFGMKFIFTPMMDDCMLHVQIYRESGGVKHSTLALRKMEATFMHELSQKVTENTSMRQIQKEGRIFLEEVEHVMAGQKCTFCGKFMALNNELRAILPPTVRLQDDINFKEQGKWKYYHEGCF